MQSKTVFRKRTENGKAKRKRSKGQKTNPLKTVGEIRLKKITIQIQNEI
jgi:hypothetical protein